MLHGRDELVALKRLGNKIRRPSVKRARNECLVRMAANHQYANIGPQFLHGSEELKPCHVWHIDIYDDSVVAVALTRSNAIVPESAIFSVNGPRWLFLPGRLTKTAKDREVPLTPTLRDCYTKLRYKDGIARIQGLVFQRGGKKITHTYRTVQELCKDQNIENFVFHDLRHCAVTNLADAGVEIETIMKIVGHSSVEMFLRYRSVKGEKLDAAMKRLDSVLNTVITPPASAAI
jgi:hypothetical protein